MFFATMALGKENGRVSAGRTFSLPMYVQFFKCEAAAAEIFKARCKIAERDIPVKHEIVWAAE